MAKDIYHETVKTALIKDGWMITNDPLALAVGERTVYVDMGSEKLFAAEKGRRRIAVEVKSFIKIPQAENPVSLDRGLKLP
ncbi:element excision factor XisH family protein [Moorena sp. SIO4G3]|uniref:element excision factor XisH family protein n=1 Tax=Moorena sp. SIO4G3 TaxID=2607821 RepID=UPI0025EC6818|nr:element excision factor XisH family protein [Moorena sp. SIO4G3]